MSEKLKMLAGKPYNPFDKELLKLRVNARKLTEAFNTTSISKLSNRKKLLKQLFGRAGENLFIEPNFQCDYGVNIHLGENFYANYNCVILDAAEVKIGDNCFIGPQVGIYTSSHPIEPSPRNQGVQFAKAINIGDNCWIGGHASILPGVSIGHNVVIAAGAVVTKSFSDNVVLAGNPARIVKHIKDVETE
ncbi:sugar O-acetyltransferase [Catenovulum maritimum]|uniref:Acetyltransferase n=1 Tax=Catenovulum maritimum TaxID=1513271 RepID=A0A0J8GRH9_9ALTE|nr:sugar O-acetyltransferase [Catenovulum maritimum]KMT65430.1 maltose acetyltransferase [Catenovulum maritimum]